MSWWGAGVEVAVRGDAVVDVVVGASVEVAVRGDAVMGSRCRGSHT
jgi:hypothetical protein